MTTGARKYTKWEGQPAWLEHATNATLTPAVPSKHPPRALRNNKPGPSHTRGERVGACSTAQPSHPTSSPTISSPGSPCPSPPMRTPAKKSTRTHHSKYPTHLHGKTHRAGHTPNSARAPPLAPHNQPPPQWGSPYSHCKGGTDAPLGSRW